MFNSLKYSYLFLRLGLAAVFLWFGADKFVHPSFWLTAWLPPRLLSLTDSFGLSQTQMIYAAGVFEILVGIALISLIFAKFFSLLAIFYLFVILFVNGLTEITIKDVGLIGGFLAILFRPNFKNRY